MVQMVKWCKLRCSIYSILSVRYFQALERRRRKETLYEILTFIGLIHALEAKLVHTSLVFLISSQICLAGSKVIGSQ